MKLKSKLIMSGVALAACAATLTSTTYAWYTTNTTVEAVGLSASTAATGDASILISRTGNAGTWKQSVSLSDITTSSMVPLQYVSDSQALYASDGTTGASTGQYITFDLFFKTTKMSSDSAQVKLGIDDMKVYNDAASIADLPKYENLVNGCGNDTSGIKQTVGQYQVDAAQCLAMYWKNADGNTYTANDNTPASLDSVLYKKASDGSVTASDGTKLTKSTTGLGCTEGVLNAKTYVETVQGTEVPASNVSGNLNLDTQVCTLLGSGASCKVTFFIYLDGGDQMCFDACKGQTFHFDLTFSVISGE